jgi:hypothetical protein
MENLELQRGGWGGGGRGGGGEVFEEFYWIIRILMLKNYFNCKICKLQWRFNACRSSPKNIYFWSSITAFLAFSVAIEKKNYQF